MEYSIAKALDIESDNKYISDYQDYTDIIDNMYTDIIKAQSDIQGYDAESLGVNYTKKGGSKKKNEIVDFMDKIKDNGVIGYVVAGDMSDKSTSLEGLPSNISGGYSTDNWKKYDTYNDCVRRVLVGQYIFDKFESYTDGNTDGILDYEIEYIIGGKSSDKDNLSEVIDKLIIIREGFNYIFLLRDSKKREEAYLMATAIVGFTGLPAMVRLTQFLIIGAWAYGESIIDVKDLLEGYRVNILKQSDEWNLELSDFGNLSSTDSEKGNRTGLAYEDYLRFMLFNQDRAKQIYRIMDMIQINLCAEYNSSFRISECIIGVRVCSEYAIKRMFSDIGIVSDIIRNKKKRFIIDVECQYSY